MDVQKIDLFMLLNSKCFEGHYLSHIREKLLQSDESLWNKIQEVELKDPGQTLLISIVGGALGIDRFYLGDTGLGIAKLLTCGGLGIWTIVDWFLIIAATREKNLEKLQHVFL